MNKFIISTGKTKAMVEYISKYRFCIVFGIFLCVGIFIGSLFAGSDLSSKLGFNLIFQDFLVSRNSCSFGSVFLSSLLSGALYLLLIYLNGLFALGSFSSVLFLLFKGLSFGLIAGCSYIQFGLKGILFSLVILLPSAFLSSLTFIFACKDSAQLSYNFLNFFSRNILAVNMPFEFKRYTVRFIIYFVVIILSSLLDGFFTVTFWDFFSL